MENSTVENKCRVYVEWESGAWASSLSPDFQAELNGLVKHYGLPSKVEFRGSND